MKPSRFSYILIVGVLVVGILLGFQIREVASGNSNLENFRKIEEAYNFITRGYVEPVDSSELAEHAIEGMLAGLDPHSVYINAEEMRSVRESFDASFEGIGIYFELIEGPEDRDTLAVLMPIAGGPSDEAGLHAGDRIVQIGDTTAIGFTNEQVQHYLKGPSGSQVTVHIARPGYEERLMFRITRDRIPLETVIAAYMTDDQTGYVRLQRFARTSHAELLEAISNLRAQGMDRLILDLRGNAGGLLEQAWQIADEFLASGEMVVYTDSRHSANNREYRATAGGTFETQPVIVLVDENSASASEIVAGAIQDHDRGLIVGRRTFGKGLVQQQFGLTDGSVLQMTVSRYFTPAGRLIQTHYENGEDETSYFEAKREVREMMEGEGNQGLLDVSLFADQVPDSLKYTTDSGRLVFGGGGILPDYLVRVDSVDAALRTVIGRRLDDEFARDRLTSLGDGFRQQWQGREDEFFRNYSIDDATFSSFFAFAERQGINVVAARPEAETEDPVLVRSEAIASRKDIETRIKAFMARRLFGVEAFYPVVGSIDNTLLEAMQLWDAASDLAVARPRR